MHAYRRFLIATSIAVFSLGASAEAHNCACSGIVLNGRLNTADFDGGVGYAGEYGGSGGGGGGSSYAIGFAQAHAFASAFAFAHASAFSHSGGMHGGWGGGGHR